jgi:hypothetical protein
VNYTQVGIRLDVTPKITPDGKVYMRVYPDVSSLSPSQVNLGNGVLASIINNQSVETTVVAQDGETVVIGGLIAKRDQKTENKIPWFGDLPGIGAMFRFRNQVKEKRELIVILTPHIVRCKLDADKILAEEARRMDWILGDVLKTQGASGMEPAIPPPSDPLRTQKKGKHETLPDPGVDSLLVPAPVSESLPPPTALPASPPAGESPSKPAAPAPSGPALTPPANNPAGPTSAAPKAPRTIATSNPGALPPAVSGAGTPPANPPQSGVVPAGGSVTAPAPPAPPAPAPAPAAPKPPSRWTLFGRK